jgi:hypothetical protein
LRLVLKGYKTMECRASASRHPICSPPAASAPRGRISTLFTPSLIKIIIKSSHSIAIFQFDNRVAFGLMGALRASLILKKGIND